MENLRSRSLSHNVCDVNANLDQVEGSGIPFKGLRIKWQDERGLICHWVCYLSTSTAIAMCEGRRNSQAPEIPRPTKTDPYIADHGGAANPTTIWTNNTRMRAFFNRSSQNPYPSYPIPIFCLCQTFLPD